MTFAKFVALNWQLIAETIQDVGKLSDGFVPFTTLIDVFRIETEKSVIFFNKLHELVGLGKLRVHPKNVTWFGLIEKQDDSINPTQFFAAKISNNGEETIGAFIPQRLGDYLMEHDNFMTMRDNDDLYLYDKSSGIWILSGEPLIRSECKRLLGEFWKSRHASEVVDYIRAATYKDRTIFVPQENFVPVKNGIIKIDTSEMIPFSHEYYFLNKINADYNPDAKCPLVEKFLSEVMDERGTALFKEIVAYCLHPRHNIHTAFMFIGEGCNGKSIALGLIRTFLGNENTRSLSLQEIVYNRFSIANLYGALANIYPDLPSQSIKNTGVFKGLTGEDFLSAERKFGGHFGFVNRAKLMFSCNKLPETDDETDAYYRRWRFIVFPNCFEGKEDRTLLNKLTVQNELSGLLNIALDCLKRIQTDGFSDPPQTDDIRELYKRLSSPIDAFIQDCIEHDNSSWLEKEKLYNAYISYCDEHHYPRKQMNAFMREFRTKVTVMDYRPQTEDGRIQALSGIKLVGTISANKTIIKKPDTSLINIEGRVEPESVRDASGFQKNPDASSMPKLTNRPQESHLQTASGMSMITPYLNVLKKVDCNNILKRGKFTDNPDVIDGTSSNNEVCPKCNQPRKEGAFYCECDENNPHFFATSASKKDVLN